MDWPRAKTILIAAFLALNGFLAYHLYAAPVLAPLEPAYLAAASSDQVARAFAPYGVRVHLPEAWPNRLPELEVRGLPPGFDPPQLLAAGEYRQRRIQSYGVAGTEYVSALERLFVAETGWLVYLRHPTGSQPATAARDVPALTRRAQGFIRAHGGLPDEVRQAAVHFDAATKQLWLRYEQQIEAGSETLPLFNGYVEVRIDSEAVRSYERRLWAVAGRMAEPEPVLAITTLLLRQLEGGRFRQVVAEGETAELSAQLGYLVTAERPRQDTDSPTYIALPTWRVTFGPHTFFFAAKSGRPIESAFPASVPPADEGGT
ncbi:MAG TPA: hypothetical protein VIL95_04555 [Bacillota bacterium]